MSDLVPRDGGPPAHARDHTPPPHHPWEGGEPRDLPDHELKLRDLLGVLRRRAWLVLGILALALGVTGTLMWLNEPNYQATAVIRMEDARAGMTGRLDGFTQQALGRSDPLLSQIQVLRSTSVLGRVVDQEGLRFRPLNRGLTLGHFDGVSVDAAVPLDTLRLEFDDLGVTARSQLRGEAGGSYGEPIELAGLRFTVPGPPGPESGEVAILHRQRAIEALRQNVNIRPRADTDVVDVEYTASNPGLAERVANALVETFRDHNAEMARQESQRRRVFIEEQLVQADSILAEAQRTLSEFREREGVFSSREWFSAQQAGLFQLDMRREELAASRGMFRSILDGLQEAELGEVGGRLQTLVASPEIAENPVVANLFQQLARYEAQRDSLVSGPWGASRGNPDVRSLEQQIESSTVRLESAVRSHLQSLDARIASLEGLRGRTEAEIRALPTVEAEEARLVQQVESMRRTVDQLREEYQAARIAEAVEVGQVEIVDYAAFPLAPVGTGRALRLAVGLMLGLVLGGGAAFLAETLNTRIRSREEMEGALRVPSVGVIPRLPMNGMAAGAGQVGRVRELIGMNTGERRRRTNGRDSGWELVTITDRGSPHAEAFRTMRTNLLYSEAVRSLGSLVVTSPTPEEGKTTTAANLAVAYAQQGINVLLVDCDMRKARVHRIFGFRREPGLTDLLLGEAGWQEVAHEVPVETLHVITSGAQPPNPSELLGGNRMRETLRSLSEHFELIILDTPPLIAGPDAAILGSFCDGVIVVVRAGQTQREAAQQAVRQLHTVGARVIGAVLNDPDGELPKYSSYYAYQYQHYGGEE